MRRNPEFGVRPVIGRVDISNFQVAQRPRIRTNVPRFLTDRDDAAIHAAMPPQNMIRVGHNIYTAPNCPRTFS
jgi:hypothetical protein